MKLRISPACWLCDMHDSKEPNQNDARGSDSSKFADFGLIYENLGSAHPNLKQFAKYEHVTNKLAGTLGPLRMLSAAPPTMCPTYLSLSRSGFLQLSVSCLRSPNVDAQAEKSHHNEWDQPLYKACLPCPLFLFARIFTPPLTPLSPLLSAVLNTPEPSLNSTGAYVYHQFQPRDYPTNSGGTQQSAP